MAKEFITSGCGDGLPFQLEQLNPTETVSQSRQMRERGPEPYQSQSSCKISSIVLLREKMFCWCPTSTRQGSDEFDTYVTPRHPFWFGMSSSSLSLVLANLGPWNTSKLTGPEGCPGFVPAWIWPVTHTPCLWLVSKQRKPQEWIKQESWCFPPGFWLRYLEN